jgi:uncharacterized protein (DUF1499 family)
MRIFIVAACIAAFAVALVIAATGPGVRLGLWDYRTGLGLIRTLALPAMIIAGVAVLALALSLWRDRALAPLAIVSVLAAAAASAAPLQMRALFEGNPVIHDVTTDFDTPPEIVAGAAYPRNNPPDYVGDEMASRPQMTVAQAQKAAFPDIRPIEFASGLEQTGRTVRVVLTQMGMEILNEGPASSSSGKGWRIEAVHTSFWYGFKDDFVVRLTPLNDNLTRIDVRSKSRVGASDLGANARRVRNFFKRMNAQG